MKERVMFTFQSGLRNIKLCLFRMTEERVKLTFQSRFTYFKDETSSYVKRNGYIHV